MKTRAAVAWAAGQPLTIEGVDLDGPRAGEVLIEVKATGTVRRGDHVIPLYTPECRQCKFCLSRKTNLGQQIRGTQGKGLMPDGTSRFSLDGKPLLHYMGTSALSNCIVVPG